MIEEKKMYLKNHTLLFIKTNNKDLQHCTESCENFEKSLF